MCIDRLLRRAGQGGLTLIELIVFIIVVSVGLAGILAVLNVSVRGSADPVIRKQLTAVAEALMEEVTLQPLTYCDPSDANVATATSATVGAGTGDCATLAEGAGAEGGQTRYAEPRFNNVSDYHGFVMNGTTTCAGVATGICDVTGSSIANLAGYAATVAVANAGTQFNTANGTTYADAAVQRIDVTVSRGTEAVTLTSYRMRYAPNSP